MIEENVIDCISRIRRGEVFPPLLVYSFNGVDVSDSKDAELLPLGRLVGKKPDDIYRDVAELQRRDLVQQRGVWRAVLPHAIANRLAARALQNVPLDAIDREIVGGPDRLLLSFARRLGFLHTSKEAAVIVEGWLKEDGFLGKPGQLNDFGRALFRNVAPVLPELTLASLERDQDASVANLRLQVPLLVSLAWEAALFERCIALIGRVAAEHENDFGGIRNNDVETFTSLFKIYLSGTHASPEQRARVADQFLRSTKESYRALGQGAPDAMMRTQFFSSMHEFEFGARSRDYGYHPRTSADLKHWFDVALGVVRGLLSSSECRPLVLATLAANFRGLWTHARMYDELELICREIATATFWPEGWVAVRETQQHDSASFERDTLARLAAIEASLRAKNIPERVLSIVFVRHSCFDPDPTDAPTLDFAAAFKKIEETALELGRLVATDDLLDQVAADLLRKEGHVWPFGIGLAIGCTEPTAVWDRLTSELAATPINERRIDVLRAFLYGLSERSPEIVEGILDEAVNDQTLCEYYPAFQSAVAVNPRAVNRLLYSLQAGKAPISAYRYLTLGRATEPITGADMRKLIRELAAKPNGFEVAVEVLGMRIFAERDKRTAPDEELLHAGRELLQQISFDSTRPREDYHVAEIVKFCFVGGPGSTTAYEISCRIRDLSRKRPALASARDDLLHALLTVQPAATLDGLFHGASNDTDNIHLSYGSWHRSNPFNAVPEDDLIKWCDCDPATSYSLIADFVSVYDSAHAASERRWSKTALRLLEKAPNRVEVLKRFEHQFEPSGWIGSRAAAIEANATLLNHLAFLSDLTLQQFIGDEKRRIRLLVEDEKRSELQRDRVQNERFE